MASNLLVCQVNLSPKGNEAAGESAHKATFNHLLAVWLTMEVPVDCRSAHLQESLERGSRELQAYQPDLGARE